jgi:peptidoglycan DL-endopeptidase CwlO
MSVARGHARVGLDARATRASALVVCVAAVLLGVLATQASAASSISSKRAEARQVESQIQAEQVRLEKQIERYNAVHQHLVSTRHQLRNNRIVLNVARHNLTQAEALLAESLTKSYKSSGQDVVSYLLASHSFSELVDNMQVMQRSNSSNSDLIAQIAATKKVIAKRTADLAKETAALKNDQAQQLAAKRQVEAGLQSLQARKAHISADIQRLIDAQQQARDAAAAAAAASATSSSSSSSGSTNIPVPPSSTLGGQAVAIAEQYLGTPYVWGGASPSGFDCSGLTMYVYAQLGVSLPHNAAAQYGMGTPVPESSLEPGDLVFFYGLGHVGMYVGGGSFIHAPHTGDVVKISSMADYQSAYVGARRYG